MTPTSGPRPATASASLPTAGGTQWDAVTDVGTPTASGRSRPQWDAVKQNPLRQCTTTHSPEPLHAIEVGMR